MANFEKDNGDVSKMVQMMEGHLVKGGIFDSLSHPSVEQLEQAIDSTESEMFSWFAGFGYSTDIADYTTLAKDYLSWYTALGASYRLELSHPGVQYNPRGNQRWLVLKTQYESLRDKINNGELLDIGVVIVTPKEGRSIITGVSISDKQTLSNNTDAVQPHFDRDLMRNPSRIHHSVVHSD